MKMQHVTSINLFVQICYQLVKNLYKILIEFQADLEFPFYRPAYQSFYEIVFSQYVNS